MRQRSCILAILALAGSISRGTAAPAAIASPSAGPEFADVVAVTEDAPWIMAVAAPVVAKLGPLGRFPLLIAISNPPAHEADWLVTAARTRRAVMLAADGEPKLAASWARVPVEVLSLGSNPSDASLLVAKRFWKHCERVVLAVADDPEALILGSALAANLSVPLLIRQRTDSQAAVAQALGKLHAERVLLAVTDPEMAPHWAAGPRYALDVLGPRDLERRLIEAWGARNVRNIILARLPDERSGVGATAWLAPYMSLTRRAPIVLSHSASAAVAETDIADLVGRAGLQPRTVTVLADYGSLGQNVVDIEAEESLVNQAPAGAAAATSADLARAHEKYKVRTEPCVPTDLANVAAVGVGRIPLESLADASVLFCRGLLRERRLATRPARLLMVANSSIVRRPLPLCETISRVTAEEFKNLGIAVDEFYGKLADSPEVLAAARNATWIIYEGHVSYQDLFDVPSPSRASSEGYFEEELESLGENSRPAGKEAAGLAAPPAGGAGAPPRTVVAEGGNRLQGPLEGLPVVVLQSCDSLDEPVLWRIDELGGVAVIGSVTPIHSGSGSALVHALADAALYRGDTLGEALRDAQNYLFCLEDLKVRLGMHEQAKTRRVALSFRLWGDPEIQVLPGPRRQPQHDPVAAQWTAPGELTVQVPAERLPEARSSKYYAQMFPDTQAASMVKQREGESLRRVTPVYFFRVSLPSNAEGASAADWQPAGSAAKRTAVRLDVRGRCLYVVHFPDTEKAGGTIVLRLRRAEP
ncbi:MAG: hypothetical protein ABSG68_18820 [Thermoguttaceae bacterium]